MGAGAAAGDGDAAAADGEADAPKAKLNDPCFKDKEASGCGDGLRCGLLVLSEENKKKAGDAAGVEKERCISADDCDKEEQGNKFTCGAKALATSLLAAIALAD